MSYSIKDAIEEQNDAIFQALNTRDSEALYHLAEQLKEQGEDEEAQKLLENAKRFDQEDNAYDEANNN